MNHRTTTILAVIIGFASAALFSLTFVINATIAQSGGPWQWTAALRYLFTIPILLVLMGAIYGISFVIELIQNYIRRFLFWTGAGTLACGLFYAGIAFAADHMAAWMVAASWQLTIVASVLIVFLFSRSFSWSRLAIAGIILVGVFGINWPGEIQVGQISWIALTALLVSSIAYPLGNQLLNRYIHRYAQQEGIFFQKLHNPLVGILMLALGSIPFWIGLIVLFPPDALQPGQMIRILETTVFAGIMATGLFFYARNLTSDPRIIIIVDSTQSSEVIFAMMLEIAFIHPVWPTPLQALGATLIMLGVVGNCLKRDGQKRLTIRG